MNITNDDCFKSPLLEGLEKFNNLFIKKELKQEQDDYNESYHVNTNNGIEKIHLIFDNLLTSSSNTADVDVSFTTSVKSNDISMLHDHQKDTKESNTTSNQTMQHLINKNKKRNETTLDNVHLQKDSQLVNLQIECIFTSLQMQETQFIINDERKTQNNMQKEASVITLKLEKLIHSEQKFDCDLHNKIMNLCCCACLHEESIQQLQNRTCHLKHALFFNQQQIMSFERCLIDVLFISDHCFTSQECEHPQHFLKMTNQKIILK